MQSAHSDVSLIQQVLRNLVANAIKYTREGYVLLRSLQQDALVRIEVVDTGTGIPPDKLPYIFDEFYQVGVEANTTRDGHGLGPNIVQRIARLLGLRTDMASQPGKGCWVAASEK